jgi:hypothetical protein
LVRLLLALNVLFVVSAAANSGAYYAINSNAGRCAINSNSGKVALFFEASEKQSQLVCIWAAFAEALGMTADSS